MSTKLTFGDINGESRARRGCFVCGGPTAARVMVVLQRLDDRSSGRSKQVASRSRSVCEGCGTALYLNALDVFEQAQNDQAGR